MKSCPTCHEIFPQQFTVCPKDGAALRGVTELAPGAVVRGKYQVIDRLGAGGMGIVYKVRHLHLDEVWALKLLATHLVDHPEFLQRFRAEALLMRRLEHPNAVRVHDFDETEEGRPFTVMEFVDGRSLGALVRNGAPLEPRRALRLCMQACEGLGAAHSPGIVHRDIKPSNILVVTRPDGSEQVKILDFGIAKVKEQGQRAGGLQTGTGIVMGTPDYMSPEQAQGLRGDTLDGRSDLYSLGVVLYQLLTGRLPHVADTPMMVLLARTHSAPPDPRSVRSDLTAVTAGAVLRSIEKDRDQRYADAAAMRRASEEALHQEDAAHAATMRLPPSAIVPSMPPPPPPRRRNLPRPRSTRPQHVAAGLRSTQTCSRRALHRRWTSRLTRGTALPSSRATVSRRTFRKPADGLEWLPTRAMHSRSGVWGGCTKQAAACHATTPRR